MFTKIKNWWKKPAEKKVANTEPHIVLDSQNKHYMHVYIEDSKLVLDLKKSKYANGFKVLLDKKVIPQLTDILKRLNNE